VPRTVLVAVIGVVAPVLAQEENRSGQHPIAVKINSDIDFILAVGFGVLGRRQCSGRFVSNALDCLNDHV
jgi:hypothetical protein